MEGNTGEADLGKQCGFRPVEPVGPSRGEAQQIVGGACLDLQMKA